MKKMVKNFLLPAVIGLAASARLCAQESTFLQNQLEYQASEADRSAGDLLVALLRQPKEARDAAMIVAQHPELFVRLRFADSGATPVVASIASEYPEDVRDAAVTLSRHSEALRLMSDSLIGAGLLGRVYAENKATVLVAMDRMSQQVIETAAATSNAWRTRLARTAAAGSQLPAAKQAFTSQVGPDGVRIMTPTQGGGAADLPSGPLVSFVLRNADQYPQLAAEIVDQWEHERNPDDFRRAVDVWYASGRDVLPWEFGNDPGERARLLAEYALFEKAVAQAAPEPGIGVDRLGFLLDHATAYPSLIDVRYEKQTAIANSQKTVISGAPYTSGGGGSSRSSGARSSGRSTGTRTRSSTSRTSRSATTGELGGRDSRNSRNSESDQGGFGGSSGFGGSGGFGGASGFGGGSGFGSGSSGFGSSGSSGSSRGTSRINSSNSSTNR